MSLTGRPSRPPLALVSSSQIFMPSSACLPFGDSGPVNDMEKPILTGSPAAPWALARIKNRVTAAPARSETIAARDFNCANMAPSGGLCVRTHNRALERLRHVSHGCVQVVRVNETEARNLSPSAASHYEEFIGAKKHLVL